MDETTIYREVDFHVPDHAVYISFNNDEDAIGFDEWWERFGFAAYAKWHQVRDQAEGGEGT